MKKLLIFSFVMAFLFSCDETETAIYDGGQTLAYFTPTSSRLEVEVGGSGSRNITIGVSTLSDSDRTVEIAVNEDLTSTEASVYTLSTSNVTIPANSYTGTFSVAAGNLTTTTSNVVIDILSVSDGGVGSPTPYTLSVLEVCPVPSDFFTGTYLMEQQSGSAPFGLGFVFGTQTVEIESDGLFRNFNFSYAPAAFNSPYTMEFLLDCNQIFVTGNIQPGNGTLGCGTGSIGQSTAAIPGTYDVNVGDDVITVNVKDFEPDGGCGTNYEAVLRFTKQ